MIRKMRKSCLLVIGALLLVLAGSAAQSQAEVNVRVNLPAIRFAAPPEVVVIPGTYVYMVPDMDVDVLFFQGYWWRPYEGQWYRARTYNGKWRYIAPRSIPRGLSELPHDYRHRLSPRYERVPHGEAERNWKKWEKEKYWDRHGERDHGGHSEQGHGEHGDGEQGHGGHGDQDREGRDEQKGRY